MNLLVREGAAAAEIGSVGSVAPMVDESSPPSPSPFPIVIGLDQVVRHRSWCTARDQVLTALRTGNGPILVTGASGTGKTLLLQELAEVLRQHGADVLLQSRGEVPVAGDAGGRSHRRVVLIDEAGRIDRTALSRLGQFGGCAVVLAATSAPVSSAVPVVCLAALAPDKVGAFVAARLVQAGLEADLFTDAAVGRLAMLSEGIPRALNRLAGAAMFLAQVEGSLRVEAGHVDEAAMLGDDSAVAVPAAAEPEPAAPVPCGTLPVAPSETKRTGGVPPSVAAFFAVSLLVLAASSIIGPSGLRGRMHLNTVAQSPALSTTLNASRETPPILPKATVPLAEPTASSRASSAPEAPAPPAIMPAFSEPPLPASAPPIVAIRYDRGAADASARAAAYALALRAAGFAVTGPVAVARGRLKPGAHYFYVEDRDTAVAVLKAVGLPGRAIKTAAPGPGLSLRPGLIELATPPAEAEAGLGSQPPGDEHS